MFEEKQKFKKGWLGLVILPLLALFIFGVVRQFVLAKPFGDNPFQDLASLGASVLLIIIAFLFLRIELHTKIDENGIQYKFRPFHKNFIQIEWKNIKEAYLRKYKPIKEYGGWGVRYSLNGKAYNIAGKHGLQIVLKNGKRLLIGTQKPEVMEEVLKIYKSHLQIHKSI